MVNKTTLFDILIYAFMILLSIIFIYPFIYIFSMSISDSFAISRGNVKIFPIGFQLDAYRMILKNPSIWVGYFNSLIYSVSGTILTLVLCSLPAYVLTAKEFKYKKIFMIYFTTTMFFSGGIIPLFLVIMNLGMIDTIWSIIIPPALSAWLIILFRTNFNEIPISLIESAKIDGASHIWIYVKLIVPLSKAIFAVLAIFSFVGLWNSYFSALMYLTSSDKQPLMIVLRKIVVTDNVRGDMERLMPTIMGGKVFDTIGFSQSIKMAVILVSILPILLIYPFAQKYFTKGILVGSVKE